MSEPVQDWVRARIAETQRLAKLPRRVDMPAVAPDLRIGTLHVRVIASSPGNRPMQDADPVALKPWKPAQTNRGRVLQIQLITARVFGVLVQSMRTDCRRREISWPRQAAMSIASDLLPILGDTAIGRHFDKDHSTVNYAAEISKRRLTSRRKLEMAFALKYREAEARARAALGLP